MEKDEAEEQDVVDEKARAAGLWGKREERDDSEESVSLWEKRTGVSPSPPTSSVELALMGEEKLLLSRGRAVDGARPPPPADEKEEEE